MANRRAPFTIDTIVGALDRSLFSPSVAALLAFLLRRRTEHFSDRARKLLRLVIAWTALKTFHRALDRYVTNNGWRRDRPTWGTGRGCEVIVVTGASGEIGAEIVAELSKRTRSIALLDLVEPRGTAASHARFFKCDITDPKNVAEVAKRIRAELGPPTILVQNAGILLGKKILDMTDTEFLATYKVNTLGAFHVLKEFLPHIVRINHGHIITVASSASYMSLPQMAEYSASKSAVLSLHEVLVQELKHRYNAPRVRASVLCPTKVETNLGSALGAPPFAFGMPVLLPWQVGERVGQIVDSGLSQHAVMPLFASLILPSVRFLPDYVRNFIIFSGKQATAVTDKSSQSAWSNARVRSSEESR